MDWLLLDFDGVLGQRAESRSKLVAERLGLDQRVVRDFYDHGYKSVPVLEKEAWKIRNEADEISFYRHVFTELTKTNKVTISDDELSKLSKVFVTVPFELIPGAEGALTLLKKKYHLGIFSNAHATRRDHELSSLNILHYFEIVLISGEKGFDKSSPRFYQDAITEAGVDPQRIRLIDNEKDPLLMATQSGFAPGFLIAPDSSQEWEAFPDLASLAVKLTFEG